MSNSPNERYVLESKLGAGTMGEVWLATDTLLKRPVAIKYLTAPNNTNHRELFLSEVQTLVSLNHPNISLTYDAGFDERRNQFYLVMEYIEGELLSNVIGQKGDTWSLQEMLDVAITMLKALHYAHTRGIVHRDIKPDNVIIKKDALKLTDFGLAGLASLLADGETRLVGTPAYMSPEQILRIASDNRSDLYAFGVILFEMITGGHKPFAEYSELSERLEAHVSQPPSSLRAFAPDIPLALERAVLRLLAKDPDDRYPSAAAVIEVLSSIQARQKFSQPHFDLLDPDLMPLVGRAGELQKMAALWTESQQDAKPHLLIVQGGTGIGKSRLIAEFLGRHVVDRGFVALVGRCDESGTPYFPFAGILATIFEKNLVKSTPASNGIDHLVNQIPGLARLLSIGEPEVSERNVVYDPLAAQWRLFTAVLTIFSELGPTTIFLENATFLDEVSVALVKFLIRQEQLPLLFIAACQSDGEAAPWLESIYLDEEEILSLGPLSMLAIKEHVTNLVGGPISEAALNLIKKRSLGNPLHMEAITRRLIESQELLQDKAGVWRYRPPKESDDPLDTLLPPAALDAFTRQIEKLSDQSRELLAPAALIESGPEFDFTIWLELLGGESQLSLAQQTLEEALQKRILRPAGYARYLFRPASLTESFSKTLSKARRRKLHCQIAEIMRRKEDDPILVGYHYEQAGLAAEAAHYLEEAAARAMSANAVQTAIDYYGRVIALVDSCSAYTALGNLYRQSGKWAASLEAYQQALALLDQGHDIDDQAQILNGLAFTNWLADRYREAQQHASAVLKLSGVSETERAMAQSHLGMILWLMGRLSEAETWCQRAVNTLMKGRDDTLSEASLAGAYNRLGLVHLAQGNLAEARVATQRALELRQQLGDYWGQGYCFISLGKLANERGDFEQALFFFDAAQQFFEEVDSRDGLMVTYTGHGRVILDQGRPNEALPLLTKALQMALKVGKRSAYGLGEIYLLLAQAYLADGDIGRARAATNDALELVEAAGNRQYIALALAMLAQIYATEADHLAAEAHYKRALTSFEQVGHRPGLLRTKLAYARFLEQQEQFTRAAELVKEARDEAAEMGLYLDNGRKS